jgi:hypothetical protein
MKEERAPKKTLKGYTEGRRPVGRPGGTLIDAADTEMFGGGGLKRPRPRLGCNAVCEKSDRF